MGALEHRVGHVVSVALGCTVWMLTEGECFLEELLFFLFCEEFIVILCAFGVSDFMFIVVPSKLVI